MVLKRPEAFVVSVLQRRSIRSTYALYYNNLYSIICDHYRFIETQLQISAPLRITVVDLPIYQTYIRTHFRRMISSIGTYFRYGVMLNQSCKFSSKPSRHWYHLIQFQIYVGTTYSIYNNNQGQDFSALCIVRKPAVAARCLFYTFHV